MFLTKTSGDQIKPLGSPGQRAFELISGTVGARLGPAHAALFAEPVGTRFGDQADWFTTVEGSTRPLAELPEADRDEIKARLAGLVDDILALAGQLEASAKTEDQRLGEALRNAVEVPSDGSVFVVTPPEGKGPPVPVLVNWAHLQDVTRPARGLLTGQIARPVAPPVAAAMPIEQAPKKEAAGFGATAAAALMAEEPVLRQWWWLLLPLWLILAVLIGWMFWLLITPCGLNLGRGFDLCPKSELAFADLDRQREGLINRIDRLERDVGTRQEQCVPPEVPAISTPPTDDIEGRLQRENAQDGAMSIALSWDDRSDLDIWVTCPSGGRIDFSKKGTTVVGCGGMLDIDANMRSGPTVMDPVEHVVFSAPSPGQYVVTVNLYSEVSPSGPHPFTLRVQMGGQSEDMRGVVSPSSPRWSKTFTYGSQP